ncbi:MAG TPA: hypothetical protein VJQ54_25465 [Candidatus Sulfotelmatobacter sp.]|nr:hypothetical protein [Candidatus Sulfotelmatobacter sp.]
MKKCNLGLLVGLAAILSLTSCGGGKKSGPPSGLKERVLASQGVTATLTFGGLVFVNGQNDTLPRVSPLTAGTSPGLMVTSPTRNILAAFDNTGNTVYAIDTVKESGIGSVRIPGTTTSMIIPTANTVGYAAVPTAAISGFPTILGAVEALNFTSGTFTTIAVNNAQTVVSNDAGTKLLVFSADSDSIAVLSPAIAVPPVDTSCYSNAGSGVCTIVAGFDRPVNAVVNGNTAYVLNCGPQCGGVQASVAVFDLGTLAITQTIPVDGATMALLNGTTLYVAGTPTDPTKNACTGETTAAKTCGRLDVVDTGSGTVTARVVITDGYHQRMDLTNNGQLFIGARDCTNVGNANNPGGGEVRGCLSIYKTSDGSVIIPPDNGNVDGFQGFTSRFVEYVAEGGNLRVYDTNKDRLLIDDFLPQGTINVVGYVGDVKAIDFF